MAISFLVALAIICGTTFVLLRGAKVARNSKNTLFAVVLAVSAAAALGIGVRFGVFGEFQIGERLRVQGAPIPLVVFVLEGERWTDFVKPLPVGYACMAANALFPVGLVVLTLTFGFKFFLKQRLSQPPSQSRW